MGTNVKDNILYTQHELIRTKYLKKNQEPTVTLGDGLDNRTSIDTGVNCLVNYEDPNAVSLSNPQGMINFSSAISSTKVAELLNAGIAGNASFGLYSTSLKAEYARASTDTRQSMHFNYLQTMSSDAKYKIVGLGNNILSSDAKDLLLNNPNDFLSVCGNSFVSSANMGAVLLVDVSIDFASAEQKNQFAASANVKAMGIGGIIIAVNKEKNTSAHNATLSVKAMQLGGDPRQLAKVFGNETADGFNIRHCATSDTTACAKIIDDIIRYAQNVIPATVDFKKPETLYTFDYGETKYSKLGVHADLPDRTPKELEASKYIYDTITLDRSMLQYLKTYQQDPIMNTVDEKTKSWLVKTTSVYQDMIDNQYGDGPVSIDVVDACYGDTINLEKRCIAAANQIRYTRSINQEYIDFASNMSSTILVDNMRLVPNNINSQCFYFHNFSKPDACKGYYYLWNYSNGQVGGVSGYWIDTLPSHLNEALYMQRDQKLAGPSHIKYTDSVTSDINSPNTGMITHSHILYYDDDNFSEGGESHRVQFDYSNASTFLYSPI